MDKLQQAIDVLQRCDVSNVTQVTEKEAGRQPQAAPPGKYRRSRSASAGNVAASRGSAIHVSAFKHSRSGDASQSSSL